MSEKVFDNAREVFRELFDTGQNYEARISDLTNEKLELSTKFEEMKQGMTIFKKILMVFNEISILFRFMNPIFKILSIIWTS